MRPAAMTALLFAGSIACALSQSLTDRSISSSKQFIVYSSDKALRAVISIGAEDVKRDFLSTLRLRDGWKYPIIFNLGAPVPPKLRKPPKYQLRPLETEGGGLKFQVDAFDASLLLKERGKEELSPGFRKLVLECLLLELAHRDAKLAAGKPYEPPPAWVLEGMDALFQSREEGIRAGLFARLISSGKPGKLDDFLRTRADRLDPASLELYRAQSLVLLQALIELPDGPRGLIYFLGYPRRSPTAVEELVACFPALSGNPSNLSRKWLLAMARASAANRTELLTARETARALDAVLGKIKAPPDPKNPGARTATGAAAMMAAARAPGGKFALKQLAEELMRVEVRAHPVYRPLVEEYRKIATELASRPAKRMEKPIASVEELRLGLSKRSSEIDDYLNWVEATKLEGTENPITETVQKTEQAESAPPRNDAVTKAIDAAEARGF